MLRLIAPLVALALGVGAAFAVVSCGEDDDQGLLPAGTADEIVANLDEVQARAEAGDCEQAQQFADQVAEQIDSLGPQVDQRLKRTLRDGAEQLQALVDACVPETTADTETVTTETTEEPTTDTTEPTTTETEPTTTETEPTTTETTPTQPTTTTTPPTTPPPTTPPPTTPGGGTPGSGGIGPGGPVGPG